MTIFESSSPGKRIRFTSDVATILRNQVHFRVEEYLVRAGQREKLRSWKNDVLLCLSSIHIHAASIEKT